MRQRLWFQLGHESIVFAMTRYGTRAEIDGAPYSTADKYVSGAIDRNAAAFLNNTVTGLPEAAAL